MTATPSWTYRPALDGLRGVAILLVMAHHFHLPFPQGGRVGVTLFFGLSGFLITSLLLAERRNTGRVDLRAFYIRRARRLLPALFALVAVVIGLGILHGDLLEALPGAAAATFYYANVAAAMDVDLGLLSHTWSLAVEEQFYVWWPLVFLALLAWRPQWSGRLVIGGAVAIAAVKLGLVVAGVDLFIVIDRADALLAGAGLAVLGVRNVRWALPVGLAAAAVLVAIPGDPGWMLVAAAAVAALVVAGADGRILAWPPLVGVGQISYSLYLWHQPVTREVERLLPNAPGLALLPLYAVVSVALAYGSYRWIERPFRSRHALHPELGRVVGSGVDRPVGAGILHRL